MPAPDTQTLPPPPVSIEELKLHLRVAGNEEDALLAGLLRTASGLCEAFTGRLLIEREIVETIAASPAWARLQSTPVRAILSVEAIAPDGSAAVLAPDAYAVDIDSNGDGWLRIVAPCEARRLKVRCVAGMAADWNGVPETLRHGLLRLSAHLYMSRDAAEPAQPPACVTALWRPWRRLRLS
jgi:uncharacterized phiE125 gp8 family phage protein